MAFDRWRYATKYSWAYDLFNAHHAELNDLYWSYVPGSQLAYRIGSAGCAKGLAVASAFDFKGNEARRLPSTLADWKVRFLAFDNWVRLCCVLSSASYLELYIQTVTALAIESDPGLLHGSPRATDGVTYLKRNKDYSCPAGVCTPCVRGTWSGRVASYERIFGSSPSALKESISDLERLRDIRNRVGHSFGRDGSLKALRAVSRPSSMLKVSEARLQKSLGVVEAVAKAIDAHLERHIGDYETLFHYHLKRASFDPLNQSRELARSLATVKHALGPAYSRAVIRHYDAA